MRRRVTLNRYRYLKSPIRVAKLDLEHQPGIIAALLDNMRRGEYSKLTMELDPQTLVANIVYKPLNADKPKTLSADQYLAVYRDGTRVPLTEENLKGYYAVDDTTNTMIGTAIIETSKLPS